MEELHALLAENEKVKACYEQLEGEADRSKQDLDELGAAHQQSVVAGRRAEQEADALRHDLDQARSENEKRHRRAKALEDELADARDELNAMTSSYQRAASEKARFQEEHAAAAKARDDLQAERAGLSSQLAAVQEERALEGRYTEALTKQRDNMNSIIENSQGEIEELKAELRAAGEELAAAGKEMKGRAERYAELGREFGLASGDAECLRDELEWARAAGERAEALGRERERYNATVRALKVDLKALHQKQDTGPETSLQEHMRLLNERWEGHVDRLGSLEKLKPELERSIAMLEESAEERERVSARADALQRDLQDAQAARVRLEREKLELNDRLADQALAEASGKRARDE